MLRTLAKALRQDDFWHGDRRVGERFVPWRLEGYPNDLRAKTRPPRGPVNEVGVPLYDYGGAIGPRLHPVTACQVALGWHERWLVEGAPGARERFLAIAGWLVEHQRAWGGGVAWPVGVTYRCYGGLEAPWVSALVQGQALSVLARASRIEPSRGRAWKRALEGAFALFETDVGRGGVRREDEAGVAFEEYPSRRPSLVLNGLISALWGLADLAVLQKGDGPARRAFRAGADALARRLWRYDLGFWSRYCLYPFTAIPNIASPYYHRAHVAQLGAMAQLHPHPAWEATQRRWSTYRESALRRGAALALKGAWRAARRIEYGPRGEFAPAPPPGIG